MPRIIDNFTGRYYALDNYARLNMSFRYNNRYYRCSEQAFQEERCKHETDRHELSALYSISDILEKSKTMEPKDNWDEIKETTMKEILKQKFRAGYKEHNTLIKTKDAILINKLNNGDTYWGVCNGVGKNMLGVLLMELREELKNEQMRPQIYY